MQTLFGRLHAEHRFAALLFTHDVDEALLLADRRSYSMPGTSRRTPRCR